MSPNDRHDREHQNARARAVEANLTALFEALSDWPRCSVRRDADVVRTLTDVPFAVFNSVLGARLEPDKAQLRVAEILEPYREKRLPALWWLGPSSDAAALEPVLVEAGLVEIGAPLGMALPLGAGVSSGGAVAGFRVERVWNEELVGVWGEAFAEGFGFPDFAASAYVEGMRAPGFGPESPFDHYVGLLDGRPVATATLFRAAGVAGIYNATTVPRARGRGIGSALVRAAVRDARREGLRSAVALASDAGFALYARLGFEAVCRIGHYAWWPDA